MVSDSSLSGLSRKVSLYRTFFLLSSQKLTRGTDNWSLAEVMHAVALLAHFHALCSFVYGCGISAEIDQEEGHTFQNTPAADSEMEIGESPPRQPQTYSHKGSPGSVSTMAAQMYFTKH